MRLIGGAAGHQLNRELRCTALQVAARKVPTGIHGNQGQAIQAGAVPGLPAFRQLLRKAPVLILKVYLQDLRYHRHSEILRVALQDSEPLRAGRKEIAYAQDDRIGRLRDLIRKIRKNPAISASSCNTVKEVDNTLVIGKNNTMLKLYENLLK